jgi:hypothetical protein
MDLADWFFAYVLAGLIVLGLVLGASSVTREALKAIDCPPCDCTRPASERGQG